MAAGDVAAFVGDDADQLLGVVALHQQAGMDKEILAARDEGVDRILFDQDDVDRFGFDAGRLEDWPSVTSDDMLNFGVADEVQFLATALGGCACRKAHDLHQGQHQGQHQGLRQPTPPATAGYCRLVSRHPAQQRVRLDQTHQLPAHRVAPAEWFSAIVCAHRGRCQQFGCGPRFAVLGFSSGRPRRSDFGPGGVPHRR